MAMLLLVLGSVSSLFPSYFSLRFKGPFALDDNDVFLILFSLHVYTVPLPTQQPISDNIKIPYRCCQVRTVPMTSICDVASGVIFYVSKSRAMV